MRRPLVGAIIVLCLVAAICPMANGDPYGVKNRLFQKLALDSTVPVAEVFGDQWKRVYFLGSYDLNLKLRSEIFGEPARQYAGQIPWDGDQRYWTILATREFGSPIIIRMDNSKYAIARDSLGSTSDRSAVVAEIYDDERRYNHKCAERPAKRICLRLETTKK